MRKKLIIIIFALIFLSLSNINKKNYNLNALVEDSWDYENNLDDADSINQDFKAYYLTKFMGGLSMEQVTMQQEEKSHWYINNNTVSRANDIGNNFNADSLSMLYFTKYKYSNFKMQIDIRQGTATTMWSGLNLRSTTLGKHPFEDGCMFYTEWDGSYRAWGDGLHGGPFLLGKLNNYSQSLWYTYLITLSGNMMNVYVTVSGTDTCIADFDVKLQWKYYQTGYVSLLSINNDSQYRNFKIKALPLTDNITSNFDRDQKISSLDSDDNLDNLAIETKSGEVNDLVDIKEEIIESNESKGCKSNIKNTFIIALILLILLLKKKENYGKI